MPSTIYLSSGDMFTITASYHDAISALLDHAGAPTAFTTIAFDDPKADWFEEDEDDPAYEESLMLVRPDAVTAVRACLPSTERAIQRAADHVRSAGGGAAA